MAAGARDQNGDVVFSNQLYLRDMAIKGYSVKSGMDVTGGGAASMTVDIAAGVVWVAGVEVPYAGGSAVITAADATYPHKDLVSIDATGTVNVTAGTPGTADPAGSTGPETYTPVPPALPADEVLLAEVWVAAGAVGIIDANVTDMRMISLIGYGAFDYGLSFEGTVSGIVGSPTDFQCADLAGYGDQYFKGYWMFVNWDAAGLGAAPQGERQLVDGYTSSNANFGLHAAFTVPLAVGDKVLLIHPTVMGDVQIEVGEMDDTITAADLSDLDTTSLHAKAGRIATDVVAIDAIADTISTAVVTTIPALHAVPAKNATTDTNMRDVIGKKDDDSVYAVGTQKSLTAYVKGLIDAGIAVAGAISDIAPSADDFDTNLAEASDDHYDYQLMLMTSGVLKGQSHIIESYTGSSKNCDFIALFGAGWTEAPANGNTFIILPDSGKSNLQTATIILAAIAALVVPDAAGTAAGLHATTDGLIGDVQTAVDLIPTTAMRGTDNAALASVVGALDDAAAEGAVTDVDTAMAYIKQCVTAEIAIQAKTDLILPGTKFATKTSTSHLTSGDLFSWTGSIGIVSIIGRVTTALEAATPQTIKLTCTPDALSATDLCATKDANAFAVGSLLTITGTLADAMIGATGVGCAVSQASMITCTCVTNGKISTVFGTSGSKDGVIVWEILWIPLTPGATCVAA